MKSLFLWLLLLPSLGSSKQHIRSLAVGDFVPLSCNAQTDPCVPWTSYFGLDTIYLSRLVIPCGICVRMNRQGVVVLRDGIDIQGTLEFPDTNLPLVLETTMIVVQGTLKMRAFKPIDGQATYTFVMTDEVDQYFDPIGENQFACGGQCLAGMKSITVAGGNVDIVGIPPDTRTWVKLADLEDMSTILVNATVLPSWQAGAEIIITQHTHQWDGQQERTIQQISYAGDNMARIVLDQPIVPPTTLKDHSIMAVEVAILSRNIVFKGAPTETKMGGHFWILRTPGVYQHLEGVDVQQFGQQGLLGRYPIHMHLSRDNPSTIAANTVRDSFQRCIVIHGTNQVLVARNVAYSIFGHCFITEDGVETHNVFLHNLGASVLKPDIILRNEGQPESDSAPAVFWFTNPQNTFIGNVAAGAMDSGFWFESKKRGVMAHLVGDNRLLVPHEFRDNVSHGNRFHGIRLYPTGLRPRDGWAVFDNAKLYRNGLAGVFIGRSSRMDYQNCFFADNAKGIITRLSHDWKVNASTFVGVSQDYRRLSQTQNLTSPLCYNGTKSVEGIKQFSWDETTEENMNVMNSVFQDYDGSECASTSLISFFGAGTPHSGFDAPVKLSNSTSDSSNSPFNLCYAKQWNMDGYIADTDGGLRPKALSSVPEGPGVILTDMEQNLHFVNHSQCSYTPSLCSAYCANVCYRSIQYIISASRSSDDYWLQVCRAGSMLDCTEFPVYLKGFDPTWIVHKRYATAHLPPGKYATRFLDETGKHISVPHVRVVHDEPLCPNTWQFGDVVMEDPVLPDDYCDEIVLNGDLEESSTKPVHWQRFRSTIELARGQGVGGSNALTSGEVLGGEYSQPIPRECAKEGYVYRVWAKVRVVDPTTGNTIVCNHEKERCPKITIRTSRFVQVGYMGLEQDSDGFQTVSGLYTVAKEHEQNGNRFTIYHDNHHRIYVDNVSMRLESRPVEDVAVSFSLDGEVESVTSRDGLFYTAATSK